MEGSSNPLIFSNILQWKTSKGGASKTCTENRNTGTENTVHIWYLVTLHDFLATEKRAVYVPWMCHRWWDDQSVLLGHGDCCEEVCTFCSCWMEEVSFPKQKIKQFSSTFRVPLKINLVLKCVILLVRDLQLKKPKHKKTKKARKKKNTYSETILFLYLCVCFSKFSWSCKLPVVAAWDIYVPATV